MVVLGGIFGNKHNENPSNSQPTSTHKISSREEIMGGLSLTSKERVDKYGIMTADFTIKNDSDTMIKDIKIKCANYSKTHTELDTNTRTVYESIYSWDTQVIKGFNMGLVHSQRDYSLCEIVDFEVM